MHRRCCWPNTQIINLGTNRGWKVECFSWCYVSSFAMPVDYYLSFQNCQVGVHIQWNHECPSKAVICDVATKYREYAKHWDSQIHRAQQPITKNYFLHYLNALHYLDKFKFIRENSSVYECASVLQNVA
jgi:hypothetical protein